MLALGWGSFRGRQAAERSLVRIVVELEAVFAALACAGLLRHLLLSRWPLMVWLLFGIFLAFAVCWVALLLKKE